MRILYIWDGNYPWDIRAEKICNALIEQNHEVFMVCRNTKRQNQVEEYKGIELRRLPFLPELIKRFDGVYTFPAFFNPVWLRQIRKVTRENNIELICVRDLPLALSAVKIGNELNVPIVLDMAECYPEMLRCIWKYEKFKFQNLFVRNPYLADIVERKALKAIDAVLVMIDESRERLLAMGVEESKIHIVSNTPDKHRFKPMVRQSLTGIVNDNPLRLIYLGLLNPSRGLDTVIEGISAAKKQGIAITLKIYGSGKDEKRLKGLAKRLGLIDKEVIFMGWVDNTNIPNILENCDAGIVPHHVCSHWNNTIPNKLFDYMASGKPVISSNVKPMKRIIESCKCGVIFEDFDSLSFVDAIRPLLNQDYCGELGNCGYSAISERYNWDLEKSKLKQVLRKFDK